MASLSSREYCSECVSTVSALANKQYQRKETTVRGREREREREREGGSWGGWKEVREGGKERKGREGDDVS